MSWAFNSQFTVNTLVMARWLLALLPACAATLLPLCADGRSFVSARAMPNVVIDLRPNAAFANGHLAGSTSLPVSSLRERMFELPPPGEWPLTLVGSAADLATARELLYSKGWSATETLIAEGDGWAQAHEAGLQSASCLRPNAFLAAVLEELERPESGGAAIDVGCGSGRDAVYMAGALGKEWQVIGCDNHVGALERARALAASEGSHASFASFDVRKHPLDELTDRPIRFVHGCRFLDRGLLERLPSLVAPGGLVIWSTFVEPAEGVPRAPPFRPSRRLQRGELGRTLGERAGFEVLCEQEGWLLTRGVWETAQFFAARRL